MADEKPDKSALLANESSILRGLRAAAERTKTDTVPIEIRRDGEVLIAFRIRPLLESEQSECQDKATRYHKVKEWGGAKVPEETDQTRYRSFLIYEATIPEDRAAVWDNKQAWKELNVLNGPDLINRVLLAGEKAAVVGKINEISKFGDNELDFLKN